MKSVIQFLLVLFFRIALWFRYRITFKGLEHVTRDVLDKPGGVLFLPNHPAVFVDPVIVTIGASKKLTIRPMVVEYMFYLPVIHTLMKYMKAIPIPNFSVSSNSLKRKRSEKVFEEVIAGLKTDENFLIYPAGSTKSQSKEILGGASGLHRILSELPEVNIVLVRVKGLWGSKFSRAFTGKAAPLFPTLKWGIKEVLKNLLFFSPRRRVVVEFFPAPKDFPRHAGRLEVNRYLENWYNQPDGFSVQHGEHPGDSLMLVPYSLWTREKPVIPEKEAGPLDELDLSDIPTEIRNKVYRELSELSQIPIDKIRDDMTISSDIGLDSLDVADLAIFLHGEFELSGVPVTELTTVGKVLALASKKIVYKDELTEIPFDLSKWQEPVAEERASLFEGKTIPEVFLNACQAFPKKMAMADDVLGPLDYETVKLRSIILADHIKKLPGNYIGIVLPASCAAFIVIMACEFAGKVPLMINWTVGPRHLETVKELSQVEVVISSWSFIDRLEGVEFNGLEDSMIMLEDMKREIGLKEKIKGKILSKKSNEKILKTLNPAGLKAHDTAVLLFTSGTENNPKGVPLTHYNILSDIGPLFDEIAFYRNDTLFGILPPFHSFGFTVATLLAPLAGIRVAFYPKPTDGPKLAEKFQKWGITIMCGAPTFLKGMLKSAKPEMLSTMRMCVTGAEKAPPELFAMIEKIGHGFLLEGYGITECSPVLSMNRPGKPFKGVGQALPGVELKIIHPETHVKMGVGEQGLILAKGPNIFSGYLNPGIEPPFFHDDGVTWYITGDLGSLDAEGYLTISGRLKRFIKIGGEMVSLSAIEEGLLNMGIKKKWPLAEEGPSLAIIAKEQSGEKPRIILFSLFMIDIDDVNKAVRESGFSNLVRISQVIQLKEIPIMGTGKVNYRALEKLTT